mgnify:CR=1 FL=1
MAARREFIDDRDLSGEDNDPPNHGKATHGKGAFLQWLARIDGAPDDPGDDEIQDWYQEWRERRDDSEQADLGRWSR